MNAIRVSIGFLLMSALAATHTHAEESLAQKMHELLKTQCISCHHSKKDRGGLILTTRETLMKGGNTGAVVIIGKAKESLLYQMVDHTEEPYMPHKAPKLPAEIIKLVADWIDAGAPYEKPVEYVPAKNEAHWAFEPLARPPQPKAKDSEWIRTPLDGFVRAAQEARKLTPAGPASRERLVRRVYFDLIGLPPTPEEVDAFLNDHSPGAYEALVDKLLASPHYGERWGRHWLDVARYADSMGYRFDDNTPGSFHFRDFVIRAFNEDMPYDQFVRWQIAGDELAPGNLDARAATGFLAVGPRERDEGDALNRKNIRYNELDDIVSTTCSSMLALTIGCARCHDHKFDPISQREYYQMLTAFVHGQRRELPMETPAEDQKRKAWENQNTELEKTFSAWFEKNKNTLAPFIAEKQAKLDEIENAFRTKANLKKPQSELEDLKYRLYANDELPALPDFENLQPEKSSAHVPPRIDLAPAAGKARFGLVYTGTLIVPNNGKYTFHLTSDDHAQLLIGGRKIVETDGLNGLETRKEPVELSKGALPIRVEYLQGENGSTLKLEWEGPGLSKRSLSTIRKDNAFDDQFKKRGEELLGKEGVREFQALKKSLEAIQKDPLQDEKVKTALLPDSIRDWNELLKRREELKRATPPALQTCQAYCEKNPAPAKSFILQRGMVDQPGEEVQLGFLRALTAKDFKPLDKPTSGNSPFQRAALAHWMTDVEKGGGRLLARVMVNRLWYYHFGEALVRTPNDFGGQGDLPALPDLLEWLASELVAGGWRLKPLHRQILLSATYQQDTQPNAENERIDPENRYWWRRRPVRIQSEIFRDSVLSVSGVLNKKMFGPGVMLPIPPELIITRTEGKGNYPKDIKDGPETWRRSVYIFLKRTVPVPMTTLFDGPDQSGSCGRREQTTVAPQALLLMNDQFIRSRSRDFARRVELIAGKDANQQIQVAFKLAFGRVPTAGEAQRAQNFLSEQQALRDGNAAMALADFCQVLFGLNEFMYVN